MRAGGCHSGEPRRSLYYAQRLFRVLPPAGFTFLACVAERKKHNVGGFFCFWTQAVRKAYIQGHSQFRVTPHRRDGGRVRLAVVSSGADPRLQQHGPCLFPQELYIRAFPLLRDAYADILPLATNKTDLERILWSVTRIDLLALCHVCRVDFFPCFAASSPLPLCLIGLFPLQT